MESSGLEDRLAKLNLPKPWNVPCGLVPPGPCLVRIFENWVTISGHVALDAHGNVTGPFGQVGDAISLEQAQKAARQAMCAILASLQLEIGDLARVAAWRRVDGFVSAAANFHDYPAVLNPASTVVHDLFGPEIGQHSRTAIGVAGLPFNTPVEISAELKIGD